MAPKSPWKKNTQAETQNVNQPKSKPAASAMAPAGHIDYAQVQAEEIEVLQAIYMDDYQEVATQGAWKTQSETSFTLRLNAPSDETVFVVLAVKLTATYPKSPPLLSIEKHNQCDAAMMTSVNKIVQLKPKELIGEVMIHEIATAILDALEDAVQRRDENQQRSAMVPSLEEERATTEAEAARLAKEQQDLIRKQELEAKAEEERGLEDLVNRERARQKEAKERRERGSEFLSTAHDSTARGRDIVDFQRRIRVKDSDFAAVDTLVNIRNGPLTHVYTAQPATRSTEATSKSSLVVKKVLFVATDQLKPALFELEHELDRLKDLRHESAINVLEYIIDTSMNEVKVFILTDYANKGSLQEMLEMVASIPTENVRAWTVQLLEALDYYHRNGIVHGRIHPNNVVLSRSLSTGATAMKLCDAGFQQQLYTLQSFSASKAVDSWNPPWLPPEMSQSPKKSRKTDVWEAGTILSQMLLGLEVCRKYVTPQTMINTLQFSESLEGLLNSFFKQDSKKRPAAFDLIPSDFLRTNAPVLDDDNDGSQAAPGSMPQALERNNRPRRGSHLGFGTSSSRYENEWVEQGRLGKGGYGEVVKARNKLDARVYAIKKIVSKSAVELSSLLSEVMLLSRLNHPYVVRYYTAWPEDEFADGVMTSDADTTTTATTTDAETTTATDSTPSFSMKPTLDFGPGSRGLDFVSSSGFKIQFGNDDSDDSEDEEAVVSDDSTDTEDVSAKHQPLNLRRTTSSTRSRPVRTTLYIQMEFCERHTLRDLILRELYYSPEEGWKLFRQILEGLVHIHGHGIIHRDLKPDNIFMDVAGNPRIGDFGLATSGQYQIADKATSSAATGDMTRSVGTTLYVAPELSSAATGHYDAKVDMYSLGIIFFEMCYPLKTAMERDRVIRGIRMKDHQLPKEFEEIPDKTQQGQIISSLISHRPSERPSSAELLRSGKVPSQIEDDTIKEALRGLSDPSSPYHQKMMSALFAQTTEGNTSDITWELRSAKQTASSTTDYELLRLQVREVLLAIFRRHGAVSASRPTSFPLSHHYSNSNVVKLVDAYGTLVQLPYDLTLPFARHLARNDQVPKKSYVIGNVFRDAYTGGAPQMNHEADFDIASRSKLNLAYEEAEIIKVIDEIVSELPSISITQICFHINHSHILDAILDHCRVPKPIQPATKEVISKLNIHENTWQKLRTELRAPAIGVSSTSLDELGRFDFRDSPEKAFNKLLSMVEGSKYVKVVQNSVAHLRELMTTVKLLGVQCKIYFCPLASVNEKFYQGSILFQCLFDTKKRSVLAAGGRYDSLIREHQPQTSTGTAVHAAGVNISVDRLISSMERYYSNPSRRGSRSAFSKSNTDDHQRISKPRRCDVLVTSFDPAALKSAAVKIVADLWRHGIAAELAEPATSVGSLQTRYAEDHHSWLVIVKQDKQDVKVRSLDQNEETDVTLSNLASHLRIELRERDQRETDNARVPRLQRHQSNQAETSAAFNGQSKPSNNVQVLMSQHRSKKSNKWGMVEAAQAHARELLSSYTTAPILAVETRDELLDKMRETRISDGDTWRRLIQSAPLNERQYLGQILDVLTEWSKGWKASSNGELATDDDDAEKSRVAFVYNFRSGVCILYDLGV